MVTKRAVVSSTCIPAIHWCPNSEPASKLNLWVLGPSSVCPEGLPLPDMPHGWGGVVLVSEKAPLHSKMGEPVNRGKKSRTIRSIYAKQEQVREEKPLFCCRACFPTTSPPSFLPSEKQNLPQLRFQSSLFIPAARPPLDGNRQLLRWLFTAFRWFCRVESKDLKRFCFGAAVNEKNSRVVSCVVVAAAAALVISHKQSRDL